MPSIDQEQMLPVGTILDHRYQIVKYLASGGFGNTYLADDTRLGDYVAIKEFFMEGVNHRSGDRTTVQVSNTKNKLAFSDQLEKFKREAYRIFKLRNEHIIHVSDLFDANGTSYYVMDYIQGTSLDKQAATKPLSEAEARDAILQVLDALRVMHAQGIYHLDVKPGNIMRDSTGHCTLIDFGASKQLTRDERSTLATSVMPYTPGYAPLEQVGQLSNNIGPWTDFYALGATLYYLLTGQQPPEVDAYDIAPDGRNFPYPANVSATMRKAVSSMMNPKHDLRPQNADEVQALIDGDAMRTSPSKEDSQEPEMKEKKSGEGVVVPLINKDVPTKPQNHPEGNKSKTNRSNKRKYRPFIYGLCLLAIVFVGWWFFFGKSDRGSQEPNDLYELGDKFHIVEDNNCPDGNHPHMIDLGLPSGTKWACCNVDASKPEDDGGYYAWGETTTKSDYSWETYMHCDGTRESCHDLMPFLIQLYDALKADGIVKGDFESFKTKMDDKTNRTKLYNALKADGIITHTSYIEFERMLGYGGAGICGTQYDVAHVKWGELWQMPSLDQIKELLDKCESEWTTVNGVKGRRFTGPNGGSIFLPAAARRWIEGLSYAGSDGNYWLSTQFPSESYYAYSLYFNSNNADWRYSNRSDGFTIRPVAK